MSGQHKLWAFPAIPMKGERGNPWGPSLDTLAAAPRTLSPVAQRLALNKLPTTFFGGHLLQHYGPWGYQVPPGQHQWDASGAHERLAGWIDLAKPLFTPSSKPVARPKAPAPVAPPAVPPPPTPTPKGTMPMLKGLLGGGSPSTNPYVGANLLTQAQADQGIGPAMMQAGMNLLANSGWSTMPQSLGANIGKAGQVGMQAYNQNLKNQLALQDLASKRAAAQTAATRGTWEHDQKVAAAKRATGQRTALGVLAKKYGIPTDLPETVILEKLKAVNAQELERIKGKYKKPSTLADAMGRQRFTTGPNAGKLVFPEVVPGPKALDMNQIITQERALQEAARKDIAPYMETMNAYQRVEAIFADPTKNTLKAFEIDGEVITAKKLGVNGAADLALIFNFMKAMDPRSVVRESEFEMAANTGGLGNKIKSLITKVKDGRLLTDTERQNLFNQSRNQFLGARSSAKRILKARRTAAGGYSGMGIDVGRALNPLDKFYEPIIPVTEYSIVAVEDED